MELRARREGIMEPQLIKTCDAVLPGEPKSADERMALVKASKWQPGDKIRITFLDGDPELRERVRRVAEEWMQYADINLFFTDDPDADIRISFTHDRGSWSYIGTMCRRVRSGEPTMNYGWLTAETPEEEVRRVVLHEFGHALGCIHEHQSPAGGIHWNKDAVYRHYMGPPNNWPPEEVDHNLFEKYDASLTQFSRLDPRSIMMYPIPREFTTDGFEVGWNRELSQTDKDFIAQMYP